MKKNDAGPEHIRTYALSLAFKSIVSLLFIFFIISLTLKTKRASQRMSENSRSSLIKLLYAIFCLCFINIYIYTNIYCFFISLNIKLAITYNKTTALAIVCFFFHYHYHRLLPKIYKSY